MMKTSTSHHLPYDELVTCEVTLAPSSFRHLVHSFHVVLVHLGL
ncbi:hypothetical protein Hanom_Chr16g01463311 [Helianthus anomalus]